MLARAAARALLCLVPFLLAITPATQVQAAPAVPKAHAATADAGFNNFGLTREVFGYATGGSLGDPSIGYPSWNFDLLSTVAFFAIRVNNQGILTADSNWDVWNSGTLTGLVNTAHAHGVKVVVTLRAGGADLCGALYGFQSTVDQIMIQVQQKGIDGVNIDYEGQLATCTNPNVGQPNYTNQQLLTNLARVLRNALNSARSGYYLSIATYSGSASGPDGFFNIPDLNQYVDSFFVMAYDMDYANQGLAPLQSCTRFCMAPVSPLTNYYWNDTTSMDQYSAVVGAGKVILGQPYYGRVSCVATASAHATATSAVQAATYTDAAAAIGSADVQPGTYSINRDPNDATGLDRWDAWYDNSLRCWRVMHWSDVSTLSVRYDLVNRDNLRGVGFWTLNYGGGSPELWSAIQSHFVACMNPTVTPSPTPPQLSGTAIQLTAASTACVNPRYEFWMRPPVGNWTIVQPYSTNATFNWSTAGNAPGVYHFSVWARDMNSRGPSGTAPNTYDSFVTLDYELTTQPCTALTASAAPASAVVGTAVTITATATGCPNPSYQFWLQPPGGGWSVVRAYATTNTFTWNTNSSSAGAYRFSVWARDASSLGTGGTAPNTYDAFAGVPYSLGVPNCSGLTASASPASSATVGTPVTVTASVSSCPRPLYQFWVLPPGGSWSVAQAYSSTTTLNWSTAGRAPGTYRFSVWTRDAASPNSYDSFSAFDYALTTAPCTSVAVTTSPPSSATAGTKVTLTASATACPNPQFEFWVKSPSGVWTLARGYSSDPTFTWDTTGKARGAYTFSVWAQDVSSRGTFGSPPYTYDAFSSFGYTVA